MSRPAPRLHTGRLLLFPEEARHLPETTALVRALSAGGLLGAALTVAPPARAFARGPRFFELIGFTGCAVQLDGGGAVPAVHLRLDPPTAAPRGFFGRNTRPPRCPHCRRPARDWAERAATWSAEPRLACAVCGHEASAWTWDWRHDAGFARLALAVEEVFPGEAQPLPALLHLLRDSDGHDWRWCAIQDGVPSPASA